jgi:Phage integrase family
LLCAAPRRSDVIRLGPSHVFRGRLAYKQKKTGIEIDIPLLPQLEAAIAALPSLPERTLFLETQFSEGFTETGFYNWFTDKARKAGVPKGRSPHGLRKACCRRLAEAGCSSHEIMSVSGHETLKEVERYTKTANRARLADSAIAALQTAQKEGAGLGKHDSKLANMAGTVSQSSIEVSVLHGEKTQDGGGGGIRTHDTLTRTPVFKTGAFNRSATPPARNARPSGRPQSNQRE